MNCSSDLKNFANSWPSASNFKTFSQSLEHFFLTLGQKNFLQTPFWSWSSSKKVEIHAHIFLSIIFLVIVIVAFFYIIKPCSNNLAMDLVVMLISRVHPMTTITTIIIHKKSRHVHIFWEGHKILQNLHLTFVLCNASQK